MFKTITTIYFLQILAKRNCLFFVFFIIYIFNLKAYNCVNAYPSPLGHEGLLWRVPWTVLTDSTKNKAKVTNVTKTNSISKSAYFDYPMLLADDKISITLATGYTEELTDAVGESFHNDLADKIHYWLLSRGFLPINDKAIVRIYETTEIIVDPYTLKSHLTQIQLKLITPGKGSAKAFMEAMNQSEVIYYAGHARGGLGPDFDNRHNANEQLVWGLHNDEHRYDNPTGNYYKKISHKEGNDLEKAYQKKKAEHKKMQYRIWMLNACKTKHFLDEFKSGLTPNNNEMDLILTDNLVYMGAYFNTLQIFLDALLYPSPIEKMVSDINSIHVFISEEANWTPKRPYFHKRIY